jgi:hypothetical protein
MKELITALLGLIDSKSTRLAASALIIATILTGSALSIVSVKYNNGWTFEVPYGFSIAFVIAYPLIFIATWFILYILTQREFTDVYSDVREKLEGNWIVTYDADLGVITNTIAVPQRTTGCFIELNEVMKLQMRFVLQRHPVFPTMIIRLYVILPSGTMTKAATRWSIITRR